MLEDETLRTRYEMFLDDINRFVEDYSIIEAIQPYNIDEAYTVSETEEEIEGLRRTNDMLKQIKDKFKRIKDLDNVVKRSTKMYFDSYITSLSSDPRVQSNMLSITEAFEDENFFQFWLADSQETHIPIVQIVLKQMMNQLRASEIEARDKKIAFTSAISAIIEDAKNNGIDVSLNDILDENGNLLLPYNETFTEKLRSLKEAVKLAQIEDPNGRDGLIYKKAKDELEKFLIDNVEREYVKEMYQEYYNTNQLLNKYPETYVKLMKLLHEEGDILSTMIDNDYSTLTVQMKDVLMRFKVNLLKCVLLLILTVITKRIIMKLMQLIIIYCLVVNLIISIKRTDPRMLLLFVINKLLKDFNTLKHLKLIENQLNGLKLIPTIS